MTQKEHLAKQLAEVLLENSQLQSDIELLAETIDDFFVLYEILNKYIKAERNLVTAIIDGEDAKIVANFFDIKLDKSKG